MKLLHLHGTLQFGTHPRTAAGMVLAISMPVTGTVVGLAGVGVIVGGAASDTEKEHAAVRESAQIKAAFPQYAAIYRKEAVYRAKFVGKAIAS